MHNPHCLLFLVCSVYYAFKSISSISDCENQFQMSAKCEWGVQVMSSGGRTMASRVPDSPPDWRLPILTSKFYASKCSSPPNGPQQMFASKCFAWDKCDSSKWLPPSFRLPNVPHQWGHLQMTSYLHNWHLTMVWSSLKLGNWHLSSACKSKVIWCHQCLPCCPEQWEARCYTYGTNGTPKVLASQCSTMVLTSA